MPENPLQDSISHANTLSRMILSYPGFFAIFNDKIHFFIECIFKEIFFEPYNFDSLLKGDKDVKINPWRYSTRNR